MGTKLLWTGLTCIVAVTKALEAIGLTPDSKAFIIAGALAMVGGLVLLWMNK